MYVLLKCNYGEKLLRVVPTLKHEGYLTVILIKLFGFKEFWKYKFFFFSFCLLQPTLSCEKLMSTYTHLPLNHDGLFAVLFRVKRSVLLVDVWQLTVPNQVTFIACAMKAATADGSRNMKYVRVVGVVLVGFSGFC